MFRIRSAFSGCSSGPRSAARAGARRSRRRCRGGARRHASRRAPARHRRRDVREPALAADRGPPSCTPRTPSGSATSAPALRNGPIATALDGTPAATPPAPSSSRCTLPATSTRCEEFCAGGRRLVTPRRRSRPAWDAALPPPARRSRPPRPCSTARAPATRSCARPDATPSPTGPTATACSRTRPWRPSWRAPRHRAGRVIDWDVHHGNGTQECFWGRADVLAVLAAHAARLVGRGAPPDRRDGEIGAGEGAGRNVNIELASAPATPPTSRDAAGGGADRRRLPARR